MKKKISRTEGFKEYKKIVDVAKYNQEKIRRLEARSKRLISRIEQIEPSGWKEFVKVMKQFFYCLLTFKYFICDIFFSIVACDSFLCVDLNNVILTFVRLVLQKLCLQFYLFMLKIPHTSPYFCAI